jgi:RNA recognition motif-containing protein
LAPGPDCAPSFIDPSVLKNHIKSMYIHSHVLIQISIVISRTLFISGVPSSYSQPDFKDMIEQVGRVESLRVRHFFSSCEFYKPIRRVTRLQNTINTFC